MSIPQQLNLLPEHFDLLRLSLQLRVECPVLLDDARAGPAALLQLLDSRTQSCKPGSVSCAARPLLGQQSLERHPGTVRLVDLQFQCHLLLLQLFSASEPRTRRTVAASAPRRALARRTWSCTCTTWACSRSRSEAWCGPGTQCSGTSRDDLCRCQGCRPRKDRSLAPRTHAARARSGSWNTPCADTLLWLLLLLAEDSGHQRPRDIFSQSPAKATRCPCTGRDPSRSRCLACRWRRHVRRAWCVWRYSRFLRGGHRPFRRCDQRHDRPAASDPTAAIGCD